MSYGIAFLAVLLCAGLTGAVSYAVHRRVSYDVRHRYHAVGSAVFLQMGVIYAVLLAFVFSEVWSQYNEAAQAVAAECGALHGSAILAHDLPNGAGDSLDRAIATYAAAVISQEWPRMAARTESIEAVRDGGAMMAAAAGLDGATARESVMQSQILALLSRAHAERETRIFQMNQSVPPLLWLVLLIYAVVLTGFVLCAGVESAASLILFSSVFAAGLVLILVVIRMLDYPFEGALAIRPITFQATLEKVSALVGLAHGSV